MIRTHRLVAGVFLTLIAECLAQSPDVLRTGFPLHALNNVDQRDAKVAMGHLLKEIVERHSVAYTTEIVEEEDEFLKKLTAGNYDFFLLFGYDYLRLRKEYPMRPILIGQHSDDEVLEEILLLTAKGLPSFSKLTDANLLVASGSGKLPALWLGHWLESEGHPSAQDIFSNIERVDNVSKAILPVFFGKADSCLVTRPAFELMNELNPQIGKRLEIRATSPPLLRSVLCLSPTYVEKEEGLVKREGLQLNKLPKGEQLITLLRMKKLAEFDPAFLENLEKLVKETEAELPLAHTIDTEESDGP